MNNRPDWRHRSQASFLKSMIFLAYILWRRTVFAKSLGIGTAKSASVYECGLDPLGRITGYTLIRGAKGLKAWRT
jgi:hypothetical protein